MSVQYKRVVDFSKNIIDAEIGYDGLIMSAKCVSTTIPTTPKKFQEGCTLAVVDKTNGTASLYFNSGTSLSPVWSPVGAVTPPAEKFKTFVVPSVTDGQTSFTLPETPSGTIDNITFSRNGVELRNTITSLSGSTITIPATFPDGRSVVSTDIIEIGYTPA